MPRPDRHPSLDRWTRTPPGVGEFEELPTIPLPRLTIIPADENPGEVGGRPAKHAEEHGSAA